MYKKKKAWEEKVKRVKYIRALKDDIPDDIGEKMLLGIRGIDPTDENLNLARKLRHSGLIHNVGMETPDRVLTLEEQTM